MAHVVACRFLRLGCSEEDHPLFRREYARNNRERGVKPELPLMVASGYLPKGKVMRINEPFLSNRVSPKWFYSNDSSVTRTQREMTHHLVACVFQVLPGHVPMTQQNQQQVSERNNVVVLARQASPGFLLVSYRRSGGSSKNPGCLLPAIDTSTADNMQAALNMQTIRDDGSDNQTPTANLTTPSQVAGDLEFWQREVEATAPGFREKGQ
ncbi:hypothetical protein JG687_00018812, partial [Phytophthora cactorum]